MAIIRPEETPLTAHYWEQARLGLVTLQHCAACDIKWHPPQPACPQRQSIDWRWQTASGAGTGMATSATAVMASCTDASAAKLMA